jgi:hypothetical protein
MGSPNLQSTDRRDRLQQLPLLYYFHQQKPIVTELLRGIIAAVAPGAEMRHCNVFQVSSGVCGGLVCAAIPPQEAQP